MSTRPRGFTLVEVLVAMVIMSIMAVMAWQGVDGIVRTRAASQARLEQTLRLDTVIAQWDQDLASLQKTSAVPAVLSCDGASVRLIRHTPQGVQVVAWSFRSDANGGAWVRWAGPAVTTTGALQESWMQSLQLQGAEAGSLRTLTGLSGWKVYFYRGNAWTNCQSSGDVAGSGAQQGASSGNSSTGATDTAANPTPPATLVPGTGAAANATSVALLPQGVRAVLSFAPGTGLNGDLTRDTVVDP